jgi:hypothetical protein
MRRRIRLAQYFVRYARLGLAPLIVVAIGSGCSDPPDPAPLQKLTSRISTADRLIVAASGDYADPDFKAVEIKGPRKGTQFLETLEFSSKRKFYHPPIHGEYQIQCFSNDQQLATLTLGNRRALLTWAPSGSTSNEGGVLKASSLRTLLGWLSTNGCDIQQREQAAEHAARERRSQAETNSVACFPAGVHDLFKPAPYGTEIPPWAAERGRKLAAAINDPIQLTTMTCKAFGCLRDYYYDGEHEQILLAALTTVTGSDLVAGLRAVENDRAALLGASRFFFRTGYGDKSPEPRRGFWRARLSEVVFNEGQEHQFEWLFETLSRDRSPEVQHLLRRLARGETGKTYPPRGWVKHDPQPRPSAYLCLALQADAEIKPEVEDLLTKTTRPEDRAALELALALLTETNHVRPEHFQFTARLLEHASLEAVERFPTLENLDALVFGGISRPEAADFFEKFVNHHWPIGARFDGEIGRWWQSHRNRFASRKVDTPADSTASAKR